MPQREKERPAAEDFITNIGDVRSLSEIKLRENVVKFLFWVYGVVLIITFTLIFLQGFNAWGFKLESTLLNWLGGATVGEIVGLVSLVWGYLFQSKKQ